MKKIFALCIGFWFLLAGMACAASNVTFTWDANSESDLAGYRLYQTQTSMAYTFGDGHQVATIDAGTETVILEGLPDGAYFWVLTAYDHDGNESGPSSEVTAVLDSTAPVAPGNVVITIIIKVQ